LTGFLKGENSEEDMYRGWVGDESGVYKDDEHMKNWRSKKVDAAKTGADTDEAIGNFLWGKKVMRNGGKLGKGIFYVK